MKISKTGFGVIFIICAGIIFAVLHEFGLFKEYIHILLIPALMIAYSLGQYSERKFGNSKNEDLKE